MIRGQSRLTVVFDNGTRLTARVISSDASRDIALLKVTATSPLTVLPFATSVRVGEEVFALGYPSKGFDNLNATAGIISSLGLIRGVAYIQHDSSINPGNSGGPLLNTNGEIVGMNTSGWSGDEAQGIFFAIKFDVLSTRLTAMKSGQSSPPTPVPSPVVVATQTPGYIFGPESGSIEHDPNDGFIDVHRTNVSLSNGIIEARFHNPYSTQIGEWSSGFLFRSDGSNTFHVVVVSSRGVWYHYLRTGDVDTEQELAVESSNHIDTTAHGSNHIRVIANGSEGWLFINGAFVATLNLNGLTSEGRIRAIGSYFQGHGISGEATRFQDFTIRRLSRTYGPSSGEIVHDFTDGSRLEMIKADAWLADGVFEATFVNPRSTSVGNWSYGMLTRNNLRLSPHVLVISSRGGWAHYTADSGSNGSELVASEVFGHINNGSGGRNHMSIIALDHKGWLFINGIFAAVLDLSSEVDKGDTWLIGNFYVDTGLQGAVKRYENVTIWSADGP